MIRLIGLKNFFLKGISLDIEAGDYFMLVGPTGAGKTILLETIAGIRDLSGGEVWSGNNLLNNLVPEKRHISLVYQDCALFPHLSVADNITFGLKIRKENSQRIAAELGQISSLLGVDHLLTRKPTTLSGGEKRKVALARSLIVKPELLLLDEPLSALDPVSREALQQELRQIHVRLGLTIIHVSHDFQEAMALGRHIAVIDQGFIRQVGTPDQIFRQPGSEFVAHFTQTRNVFKGESIEGGQSGIFRLPGLDLAVFKSSQSVTHACIRPEEIAVSLQPTSDKTQNCFTGTVTRIVDKGPTLEISVDLPPVFSCLVTRRDFLEMDLKAHQSVNISFKPEAVHLF